MIKTCVICGTEFEILDPKRMQTKYCSKECRARAKALIKKKSYQSCKQKKERIELTPAERIAHQADKTIWVRDYAERQKCKTLDMIGHVEIAGEGGKLPIRQKKY